MKWFSSVNRYHSVYILLIVSFFFCQNRVFAQSENVVDEIVAVVGDQLILRSDVDGYVMNILQQRRAEYSDAIWMDALNRLIDQQVLATHAKRDTTITVSDDQLEQALDNRINQLTAQLGGQARLEEMYGKSMLQIKADLREEFRNQMYAEQFQSRKLQSIKITPSEIRTWFSQFPTDSLPTLPDVVRIAHIVRYPLVTEEAREEAMEIISAIRDSVVSGGTTIEEMARQFSDDQGSAANGGRDTGRKLSELVPEFAAVAARISIGEISQVFETQFGLHFLRINDRKGDVIDYNHVLIQFDDSKTEGKEAIAYLNVVRDSIMTEKIPFEIMARRHSQETETATQGGRVIDPRSGSRDLPLQALGPTWQTAINNISESQISQPAEVDLLNGRRAYHILLLQKRVPSHRVSIETDYERIEEIALQDKQSRVLTDWLNTLRKDVYIDMRGKARELVAANS